MLTLGVSEHEVAAAIAFFESSDDVEFLLGVLRSIQPRAAAEVRRQERRGRDVPAPLPIVASEPPATREAALQTVRATSDFGQLQALSRAIGRRVEALRGEPP